jgi:hypothetical protein
MFLKFVEHVSKLNNLQYQHKGIVIDNNDPKKLGRIKCRIIGLAEESDAGKNIWVYPHDSKDSSSGQALNVPEKNKEVIIVFPYGNIYYPVYIGYWGNEKNALAQLQAELFAENYPQTYGEYDTVNNYWRINKSTKLLDARHYSKNRIRVYANGDTVIDNVRDITINNDRDITINNKRDIKINNDRDIEILNKKDIKITVLGKVSQTVAQTIDITAGGKITETCPSKEIISPDVKVGAGAVFPCVNSITPCILTGIPHTLGSSIVKIAP